jgi:hypothetical protein
MCKENICNKQDVPGKYQQMCKENICKCDIRQEGGLTGPGAVEKVKCQHLASTRQDLSFIFYYYNNFIKIYLLLLSVDCLILPDILNWSMLV